MGGEVLTVEVDKNSKEEYFDAFLKAEMELIARMCRTADIIITGATLPVGKAPVFFTEELVSTMKPGSVVVDLAARSGGYCAITRKGETYVYKNVTIIGNTVFLPCMASQGSQLYSEALVNLLELLVDKKNKRFKIDVQGDEVIRTMTVCLDGERLPPHRMSRSAH